MPPRRTTDFGALFESLVDDLRIQIAASVDRTLSDFGKRLARIERRLDQLDPENTSHEANAHKRACTLCEKTSVARGMCSAHYQQWRYRERKGKSVRRYSEPAMVAAVREKVDSGLVDVPSTVLLTPGNTVSTNN
ncbi:MAG: hypothetical protein R3C68_13755 [Myxococcota bacterium]